MTDEQLIRICAGGTAIFVPREILDKYVIPAIQKERKELEIELAKITLIIDALERDDIDNLGPSLMDYLNKEKEKLFPNLASQEDNSDNTQSKADQNEVKPL